MSTFGMILKVFQDRAEFDPLRLPNVQSRGNSIKGKEEEKEKKKEKFTLSKYIKANLPSYLPVEVLEKSSSKIKIG